MIHTCVLARSDRWQGVSGEYFEVMCERKLNPDQCAATALDATRDEITLRPLSSSIGAASRAPVPAVDARLTAEWQA